MKKVLTGIVCLFVLASCSNTETPAAAVKAGLNLDSAKAAIAASNKLFGEAFQKNDSASFVARYASDACINPTGFPQMCGSAAIGAYFKGGYEMGVRDIKLTTDEVLAADPYVIETGKYEMIVGNGISAEKGKFIVIWKQENGSWKMYKDIWNSDAMPPPPTPPLK